MGDTLARAQRALETRIDEIDDERRRLEATLEELRGLGSEGRVPRRRLRPPRRKRRSAPTKRAAPGKRREQFLAALEPGTAKTPATIATETGISAQQVSSIGRKLHAKGAVRKVKNGYKLKPPKREKVPASSGS